MKVLGICNANNSGAALIKDGNVIAAANEERFTREKLTRDFPLKSIEFVLRQGRVSLDEIDYFACGAWKGIDNDTTLLQLMKDLGHLQKMGDEAMNIAFERISSSIKSDGIARKEFTEGLTLIGIEPSKVIYCDHHLSHASVAYFPSPFDKAIVLVADGRGDFRSTSIWLGSRESGLELVDEVTELFSLGAMYGFITKLLGFTPDRHEGKVTGLAALGKPSPIYNALRQAIFFDKTKKKIVANYGDFYRPYMKAAFPKLEKFKETFPKEDFAYAAQAVLEEVLCEYLSFKTRSIFGDEAVNVCLSGGCFANVRLNQKIFQLSNVNNVYISPEMGDGGNALGGAVDTFVKKSSKFKINLPNVYLGPKFSKKDIELSCEKYGLRQIRVNRQEKIKIVTEKLSENKIVGWFSGRMEYGPRALGARSILASPSDESINKSLNDRLQRTEFMPFAPVTTIDLASLCFKEWQPRDVASKFMTMCYDCTPKMKEKCPATVHVDGTARPQIIIREENEDYFDLVTSFFKETDIPALINTSFNHHEEPIVCSPDDAIGSFLNGNTDLLVFDDCIIFGENS